MNKTELLKEHSSIQAMDYWVSPETCSEKDRLEFISAIYRHIDRVQKYICTELNTKKYNAGIARRDFWWVSDAKSIILYLSNDYDYYDKMIRLYIRFLIESLYKMIDSSECDYVVYPDIRKNRVLAGYKTYEKIDGKWAGMSYTKFKSII